MEAVADETKLVPLKSIFIAPENPRATVEADDGIPQLGRTLVACQVYPILARPALKGETGEFGALDGRRRFLGFQSALAEGLISEDHLVAVTVVTDKARQHAAVTLANHEREAGHITDVITAIGRMKKAKLKSPAIAKALGYTEMQIRRWTKLADLQPSVLSAMRADKITLETAQMMTRLSPESQDAFAEQAVNDRYGNINYNVRQAVMSDVVTVEDDRFGLVSIDDYTAAGGKLESDLFGATSDVVLDVEILQRLWTDKVAPITAALEQAGLSVTFGRSTYYAPEGFERLPYNSLSSLGAAERRAYEAARAELENLCNRLKGTSAVGEQEYDDFDEDLDGEEGFEGDDDGEVLGAAADVDGQADGVQFADDLPKPTTLEVLLAHLAETRLLHLKSDIGAIVLQPDGDLGLSGNFYAKPAPVVPRAAEDDGEAHAPQIEAPAHTRADVEVPKVRVDVEGVNNSLHERYTVVATRGLTRTLADDPNAAFVLLVARLFVSIAMPFSANAMNSISTIKATEFSHSKHQPIGELDGEVAGRLVAFKEAYVASGLRPIPWVDSMPHSERMELMTVLVALSLDGKEFNTSYIRQGARAEAAEICELTGHDITNYWTPDAEFFAAHSKKQILPMLPLMGLEDEPANGSLKKDELAGLAAQSAEAARWAPASLSWKAPEAELVEVDDLEAGEGEDPSTEGADSDADDVSAINDDGRDGEADADLSADETSADGIEDLAA